LDNPIAVPDSSGRFVIRRKMEPGKRPFGLAASREDILAQGTWDVELTGSGGAIAGVGALELFALGPPGLIVAGRAALAARGTWAGFTGEAGVDLDDRDAREPLLALATARDPLALAHRLDPTR